MSNRKLTICILALAVCAFALPAMAQMTSTGIDCSQISALNLLKQDNMRAGLTLIECGIVQGGEPEGGSDINFPAPPNVLVSNRSCSGPTSCTKSENMVWENGSTVVVNFNDHNCKASTPEYFLLDRRCCYVHRDSTRSLRYRARQQLR